MLRVIPHNGFPVVLMVLFLISGRSFAAEPTPEQRAVAFLTREVPAWPVENKCFSCHNSGVAAGTLYSALRQGYTVPDKALADTTDYLSHPDRWVSKDKSEPPILMRVQFGAALVEALDAGIVKERQALLDAAKLIAAEQRKDGSWRVDAYGSSGSPTTLGTALTTHLARRVLLTADAKKYAEQLAKTDKWLRQAEVDSVLDAASLLLALDGEDDAAKLQRGRCLDLLRKSQDRKGGWGPTAKAASEPFDTALALLALMRLSGEDGVKVMLKRGREALLAMQEKEGNWPETTRPAGEVSYAQRIATSAWATRALLATAPTPTQKTKQ
jgi:hypothetical protein